MQGFLIELKNSHGLTRFRIKVVKRVTIPQDEVLPEFLTGTRRGLRRIYVGRNVTDEKVQRYLEEYLRVKGIWEHVISLKTM